MTKLVILRGLPDSNKDEIAKTRFPNFIQIEAIQYFLLNGKYYFNTEGIAASQAWCKKQVKMNLITGNNVIVTNTFVKKWEVEQYVQLATKHGADIELITATGQGVSKINVPQEVIERMKNTWEDFDLAKYFKIK